VLVVDDEPAVRFVLRVILELDDYEVVEAGEGAEALARLAERPADLILTDFMMPVMDGGELIDRIRADADLADIPILMISASSAARERANADAFLEKPFEPDEIRSEAARMMRRS
jgi:two-component system chemotaxis response regulator CheY